jgi:MoxR-like ATPase
MMSPAHNAAGEKKETTMTTIETQGNGAAAKNTIDLESVRKRFGQVKSDLGQAFREREAAVECIILAALSGSHALLVGPPGTAKSALFYGFLACFAGVRKFQTLVTKFGTEDEYFGPVKLSALKNDKWERNLDGRLAAVETAFLDEVFKGSDSVLNTLLSAMNERLYKGQPIPLRMLVGASNELPEEEILAAVYDRFLMRDVVDYVQADATWMQLLSAPPTFTPSVQIDLAEWDAARKAVGAVALPEGIVRELLRVKNELKANGITVSDRRWISLTQVLRAAAWLDGAKAVELDHLTVLRYGLWQKPDEIPRVIAVLDKVNRSKVAQAVGVIDEALRTYARRPTDPATYRTELPRLADAVAEAALKVQEMLADGVSRRASERIAPKLAELGAVHEALKADLKKRWGV